MYEIVVRLVSEHRKARRRPGCLGLDRVLLTYLLVLQRTIAEVSDRAPAERAKQAEQCGDVGNPEG